MKQAGKVNGLEDKYETEEQKRLIKKENTVAEIFNSLEKCWLCFCDTSILGIFFVILLRCCTNSSNKFGYCYTKCLMISDQQQEKQLNFGAPEIGMCNI